MLAKIITKQKLKNKQKRKEEKDSLCDWAASAQCVAQPTARSSPTLPPCQHGRARARDAPADARHRHRHSAAEGFITSSPSTGTNPSTHSLTFPLALVDTPHSRSSRRHGLPRSRGHHPPRRLKSCPGASSASPTMTTWSSSSRDAVKRPDRVFFPVGHRAPSPSIHRISALLSFRRAPVCS